MVSPRRSTIRRTSLGALSVFASDLAAAGFEAAFAVTSVFAGVSVFVGEAVGVDVSSFRVSVAVGVPELAGGGISTKSIASGPSQ